MKSLRCLSCILDSGATSTIDPPGSVEAGEDFRHRRFRSEAVEFAQCVRLAMFDEFIRPADALDVFGDDGSLSGFASFGAFRAWPAYKYSIEHSVYIRADKRGGGLGRLLLAALIRMADERDYHMMIGGIDSTNEASVRLHKSLGFTHCASIRQAGYKFGRWLDLEFYQLLLPGPARPEED